METDRTMESVSSEKGTFKFTAIAKIADVIESQESAHGSFITQQAVSKMISKEKSTPEEEEKDPLPTKKSKSTKSNMFSILTAIAEKEEFTK